MSRHRRRVWGTLLGALALCHCSPLDNAWGGSDTGADGGTTVPEDSGVSRDAGVPPLDGHVVRLDGDQVCTATGARAAPRRVNADIIFAVDTSPSMMDECRFVQNNMNRFSEQIVAAGVDVRVVMLAKRPIPFVCPGLMCPPSICIAAPLGSGECPADQNPPNYVHPPSEVDSTDALVVVLDKYPEYQDTLRPETKKYVVVVTDDNATDPAVAGAEDFVDRFTALDPSSMSGVTVHGIYCFADGGDCASEGTVYRELITLTGGIHGDLAEQDFQPIFDNLAEQVITAAQELPCEYAIPPPPGGELLNASQVNVLYTDSDGEEHDIYRVASQSECHLDFGGWYYDDPTNPEVLLLCPASCDLVAADPAAPWTSSSAATPPKPRTRESES